ncbi:FecR family protein [bacterium]|nr:FecR family protein [bacterium]
MKNQYTIVFALLFIAALVVHSPSTYAVEAVASIKALDGTVDILRNKTTFAARTGLILHDKDLVVTYQKSKVTLIFRDGTEIRIFPNTRFLIEKSEESQDTPRRFLHNFMLKVGSFWGKFTKNRQRSLVKTPTATVGVKGTTFAMAERDSSLDVSLSTGEITISNQTESIDLVTGKIVKNISATGTIQDKVSDITYQVVIKPDHNKIEIPEPGKENEVYFTLQLVNLKTNKNVDRPGEIYISLVTDKIEFEDNIRLNSRGYARVKALIKAFEAIDYRHGQIEIFAIMDGEEFIDVAAGRTVLTYDPPDLNRLNLKIDASSGEVE